MSDLVLEDPYGGTTPGKPCRMLGPRGGRGPKRGCPVQMIFIEGTPYLRFCKAVDKPGHLIKMKSSLDAWRKTGCICDAWEKNRKRFSPRIFESCKVPATLGGKRKRKRKRRRR